MKTLYSDFFPAYKKGDVGSEATYNRLFISGDIIAISIFSIFEVGKLKDDFIACS
jgi:hypothetical protein